MNVKKDPIVMRRLLLVRQLYQHAVGQSRILGNRLMRIHSAIGFDLATETLLYLSLTSLDSKKTPPQSIPTLIDAINDTLGKGSQPPLEHTGSVLRVRSIRNDCQHKAKYPNEEDVQECRLLTRDFLKTTIKRLFDCDFDSMSLSDEIQDEQIQELLAKAQKHMADEEFGAAIAHYMVAFDTAIAAVTRPLTGSFPDMTGIVVEKGGPARPNRELADVLRRIHSLAVVSAVGLDLVGFMNFSSVSVSTGVLPFNLGAGFVQAALTGNATEDQAVQIAEYVIDAIVHLESVAGDLSQPFGIRQFQFEPQTPQSENG